MNKNFQSFESGDPGDPALHSVFSTRANAKEKLLLSISLWASASQTFIFSLCVIMQRENTTCSDEMKDFSLCPQDLVK